MAHLFRIGLPFAADVVVQDTSVCRLVDVGECQIHAVAFDSFRDAADKHHGAVRFDPFDYADVGQRIIQSAVAIEVPGVVEEDEIAGLDHRSLVEPSVLAHVVVNQSNAVRSLIRRVAVVQIDAMFEVDGTSDTGAVIGHAFPVALDQSGTEELGGGVDDSGSGGGG